MSNGQTSDDIIAEARSARRELADLDQQIQEQIDQIDFDAFRDRRDLTPEERSLRQERRANQAEVREAYVSLAYVTLRRLDESDEVKRLQQKMKEINLGLSDDLDRLKRIERYAEVAAKIADSIAKIAAKVAERVVDLAI